MTTSKIEQNPVTRGAIALSVLVFAALALLSSATVSAAEVAAPKPPDRTAGASSEDPLSAELEKLLAAPGIGRFVWRGTDGVSIPGKSGRIPHRDL